MQIKYTENIDEKLESFSESVYDKYEADHGEPCNYKKFAFYIEEDGKIVGLVSGYTCWTEVYIDDICVDEKHRGNGYGKKLLEKVEEYFKGKDYENIALCTNEYNAPGFYKKCGYELEFVRKKKNPKLTKYFFNKWIK